MDRVKGDKGLGLERMLQGRSKDWLLPILAGGIFLFLYWWKGSFEEASSYVLNFAGGLILTYITLTRPVYLFYGMILLLPLSIDVDVMGGAKFSFPSEGILVLLIGVSILFNSNYRKGIIESFSNPLIILLGIDLLFLLIISFFSSQIDVSIKRVIVRVLFFFGFVLFMQQFRDKRQLLLPWIIYALGLIPVMFFTLRNHAHFNFNPRVVFDICAPYYSDHTIYGACLAFILPLIIIVYRKRELFGISSKWKIPFFLLIVALIISEILALSRASILSLVVASVFGVLLYFRIRFSRLVMGLAIVGGMAFALSDQIYEQIERNDAVSNDGEITNHFNSITNVKSDASNLERLNRWICAWRMFEEKPFTGFGPGTYQFEYNQFQSLANKTYISTSTGDRGNAHSEYLTYLSETGWIGLLIFLLLIGFSIYVGMENHYQLEDAYLKWLNLGVLLGLITFYFHGLFNSFIDQSKMAFLVFSALGTIVWIREYRKRLT